MKQIEMKIVKRLLLSLIPLILLVPLSVYPALGSWGTLTYNGSKHFDTIDAAIEYQKYIVGIADDSDADYVSVEISKSSPPVVSYRITLKPSEYNRTRLLPERKRLNVGTQHMGITGFWVGFIIVSLFALFLMSIIWWCIWTEEDTQKLKDKVK